MAEAAPPAQKFGFKSISSEFESEPAAESTVPEPASATEPAAPPATEEVAQKPENEVDSAKIIADLKKQAARAKRFGGDATEIEKIIARAEKFGVASVSAGIKKLDKPLGERRSSASRHAKPYDKPDKPSDKKEKQPPVELSEADKEKLRKRAERFGGK